MSPNANKIKGSAWESQAVEELNELINGGSFRRIPGSGAIGTTLGEPMLTGDIKGLVNNFPFKLKIECKTGYGGATQLAVKKEWLDKIKSEAQQNFSFPALLCKFSGSRSGVKHFVVFSVEQFAELINMYTDLKNEFDAVYTELQEIKESKGGRVGTG